MIDDITLAFIFYCIQLFCQYSPSRQMQDAAMSVWLRGLLRPIYQDGWLRRGDHWLIPDHSFREVFLQNNHSFDCFMFVLHSTFKHTRPKPAFGRQGLDWDRWARIQFSQVHFGAKLDLTDLLWCKNVTSPTGGSNRPPLVQKRYRS